MAVIGSVVANLVANTRQFENGMQRGARSVKQVGTAVDATNAKLVGLQAGFGKSLAKMSGLSNAFKGFAAGGVAGLAIGASFDLISLAINKATEAAKKFGESLTAPKKPKPAPPGFLNNLAGIRGAVAESNRAFARPRVSFFDPLTTAAMRGSFSDDQFAAQQERMRLQTSEFQAAKKARDRVANAGLPGNAPLEVELGEDPTASFNRQLGAAQRRLDNARAAMRANTMGRAFGDLRTRAGNSVRGFVGGDALRGDFGPGDAARMAGQRGGDAIAAGFRMFDRAVDKFGGAVAKSANERERVRKESAAAFTKELRSPFEVFKDNLAEMKKAGLSGDTLARGVMRAKNQLRDALRIQEPQLAQAFEKGSVAAQSAINRANLQRDDPSLKELRDIAENQQRIADELARGLVIRELPELKAARL